ncbi:Calcium-independent phospholipase A2-gamma [Branchiostoma belcheri]|nr:Calcium-independent phospholipase A2-gamma [Branchiostoma belcheri]
MARKWPDLLIFLLIILKEPNMPEAYDYCGCSSTTSCNCVGLGLTSIPQNLQPSVNSLDLTNNQITTLSQPQLSRYRNLRTLNLVRNHISVINNRAFYYQTSLNSLDLQRNQLTSLRADMFEGLSNLETLDLYYNCIRSLEAETFSPTPQLQTLNLSANNLTSLPPGLFDGLNQLQTLNIYENYIKIIPPNIFKNLQRLRYLNLSTNKISIIPTEAFVELPKLEELYLFSNRITNIRPNTVSNLPQLTILRLDYNKLHTISPGAFTGLAKLQQLRLQNNQLTSISFIGQYEFLELALLYLNDNNITHIPDHAFSNQPKLSTVHLHRNKISSISAAAFRGLAYLAALHLHENYLQELPDYLFLGLSNLRDLRLNNNAISHISLNTFTGVSSLRLSLSDNRVRNFPLEALSKISSISALYLWNNQLQFLLLSAHAMLSSITTVNIAHNPWHCDCRMVPFRQAMTGSHSFDDQIICEEPSGFLGQKLKDVNPTDLTCEGPNIVRFVRGDNIPLELGETLSLVCEASGIPKPDITVILPSGQNATVESVGRVTVDTNGTVTVTDLTLVDAGSYTCIAASAAGTTFAELSVTITEEPPSTTYSPGRNLVPPERATATGRQLIIRNSNTFTLLKARTQLAVPIQCSSPGLVREPSLESLSHSLAAATGQNQIIFEQGVDQLGKKMVPFRQAMNRSHLVEDQITCEEPSSFQGKKLKDTDPKDLSLICEEPTIVRFHRTDRKKLVLGGTLHLVCEASGTPTPDITVILPSGLNATSTVESTGRVTVGVGGSITVKNLTAADVGQYICFAENAAGFKTVFDTLSVTILVAPTPTPMPIPHTSNKPENCSCYTSAAPSLVPTNGPEYAPTTWKTAGHFYYISARSDLSTHKFKDVLKINEVSVGTHNERENSDFGTRVKTAGARLPHYRPCVRNLSECGAVSYDIAVSYDAGKFRTCLARKFGTRVKTAGARLPHYRLEPGRPPTTAISAITIPRCTYLIGRRLPLKTSPSAPRSLVGFRPEEFN